MSTLPPGLISARDFPTVLPTRSATRQLNFVAQMREAADASPRLPIWPPIPHSAFRELAGAVFGGLDDPAARLAGSCRIDAAVWLADTCRVGAEIRLAVAKF